jgi:subtilase family serine protease
MVAIVDAYHHPTAESDLNTYRKNFGLLYGGTTSTDCTKANGCFRQVNQDGQDVTADNHPDFNDGWAQEIAIDIEMVSAICPRCKILLVEANSNSYADLGKAVDRAAALGANAISNSYGSAEFLGEASYQAPYNKPGIAVTVSSGDSGYGAEFPAASQYVTAVGGTTLVPNSAAGPTERQWSETVWSGAGSGCSRYIPKPTWQTDGGCSRRTVADVAAVADPSTGVAVYYSGTPSKAGWYVYGGTSVAAPIVASVYALAGNAGSDKATTMSPKYPYQHPGGLFDVKSGSNGRCPRNTAYLCTGVAGYDGPTGLGTPNGLSGF